MNTDTTVWIFDIKNMNKPQEIMNTVFWVYYIKKLVKLVFVMFSHG